MFFPSDGQSGNKASRLVPINALISNQLSESSANRKLSRHGLLRSCKARCSAKVKSFARHDRFVIALHSPIGAAETGLPVCPSEKMAAKPAFGVQRDTFSSPVSKRKSQN